MSGPIDPNSQPAPQGEQGNAEPGLGQSAFSTRDRDPQTLSAAWNSLIESAANRLIARSQDEVNASMIEEARRSIVLRPIATDRLDQAGSDERIGLDDFKMKIKLSPVSVWYKNLIDGDSADHLRTRTFLASDIARGQNVEPARHSDQIQALSSVLVNQIVAFEEAMHTRYKDEVGKQDRILFNRSAQMTGLQRLDLLLALDETAGPSSDYQLQYVKELEQEYQFDHDKRKSEQERRVSNLEDINTSILHSNLSLLSAVLSDSGQYISVAAESLSEKSRHVLSRCSITHVVEAMLADPNVWPQYRAQQIDLELLDKVAHRAAEVFLNTVPTQDHRDAVRINRVTQEAMLSRVGRVFISDAIDRDPRFSKSLSNKLSYGWSFSTKDGLEKFSNNKETPEERRKILCNYFLSLLVGTGGQELLAPDQVNSLLKRDHGKFRQAVVELTPVIRLCKAVHDVNQAAFERASNDPKAIEFVEALVPSRALADLGRFIELCEQVAPECGSSPNDAALRAEIEGDRAKFVDKAKEYNQAKIVDLGTSLEQMRAYRAELVTLGKLKSEMEEVTNEGELCNQEIESLQERLGQGGIKGAIWRRTKGRQEEEDLYSTKRQIESRLAALRGSIDDQAQIVRAAQQALRGHLYSAEIETLDRLDTQIKILNDQKDALSNRDFV